MKKNRINKFIILGIILPITFIILTLSFMLSEDKNMNKENNHSKSIYDFSARTIEGTEKSIETYKNKVFLIVNTASQCGFTPQYKGLEELYEKYNKSGFEILGFPCNQFKHQEPGSNEEIKNFCTNNFNIKFQMFEKIDVNGDDAHPIYKFLTKAAPGLITDSIKWNFTKFLIDKNGNVVKRFAPQTVPDSIAPFIEELLYK